MGYAGSSLFVLYGGVHNRTFIASSGCSSASCVILGASGSAGGGGALVSPVSAFLHTGGQTCSVSTL